jgi:thioredoxin-like negative regulator of GroEL
MVHRLEADYWGKVDFVYLDQYDPANFAFMDQHGITWRPTFVLITPDGKVVSQWFGPKPEDELRTELDNLLTAG